LLFSIINELVAICIYLFVWAGHVARMVEKRNAYCVLVVEPEGKGALGRPRRRWVDYIKTDIREIERDGMDWIDLAQDRD
jgi:hypothetical protein